MHRSITWLLVVAIAAAACSTGERPTLGVAPAEELWREEMSLAELTLTNRALADIGVVCVATEHADGDARLCLSDDADPPVAGDVTLLGLERSLWVATALAWVDPGTDVRLDDGATTTPLLTFALPDGRQAAFVLVEAGPWTLHFVHDGRTREYVLPVPGERSGYPTTGPEPTQTYPETGPDLDSTPAYPETGG